MMPVSMRAEAILNLGGTTDDMSALSITLKAVFFYLLFKMMKRKVYGYEE